MNTKIENAINEQINAELYSAYLYLSMSAWFEEQNLPGMAQWMRYQTEEENMHAMKFFDYILERNGRVILKPIEGPDIEWKSPLAVFEASYAHEQMITALINTLVDLSLAEHDHASSNLLQWFVNEQVEEESNASTIVDKLKMVGDHPMGVYMLDKELGARPAPTPIAPQG